VIGFGYLSNHFLLDIGGSRPENVRGNVGLVCEVARKSGDACVRPPTRGPDGSPDDPPGPSPRLSSIAGWARSRVEIRKRLEAVFSLVMRGLSVDPSVAIGANRGRLENGRFFSGSTQKPTRFSRCEASLPGRVRP